MRSNSEPQFSFKTSLPPSDRIVSSPVFSQIFSCHGTGAGQVHPVSLSLQEQTRPPHSVKLGILGRLVPAGM